jgi:5-formyltetrahydrofolate cyclo-ligase
MRSSLNMEERNELQTSFLCQFKQLQLATIKVLHHYIAVKEQYEISVNGIIDAIHENSIHLIQSVPVMKGEDMISVFYQKDMLLSKNEWGIEEPVEQHPIDENSIDCVLVPLLAFDKKGNRVGYGKGCYDRFLTKCRKDVIKIGFSYFPPLEYIDDTDKFDIPLNYCITPERIYEFG